MRRLARLLGSVALAVVALLLCGAVGELALRLTSPTRSTGERQRLNVYRTSGTLSHELRPSWQVHFAFNDFAVQVRTNALGFRGTEATREKPDGRVRILVVGDSFAFGWGVENEEMFSSVLEDRLRAKGVLAEVISAGVPGYAADQHLIFLRERGFALAPDLILIAICGNDTTELAWSELRLDGDRLPVASVSRRRFVNRRGEMRFLNAGLYDLPGAPIPESLRRWLVDHSWAYGWLRIRLARAWATAMEGMVRARDELEPEEVPTEPIASLSAETIDRSLRGSEAFRLRYHRYLHAAIETDAERHRVPLRTLLVEGAEDGLREDCARSRCLDQAEVFRRAEHPETFLPVDGHWSAEGHRRIGEALAAWLLADAELALRSAAAHRAAPAQLPAARAGDRLRVSNDLLTPEEVLARYDGGPLPFHR